MNESGVLDQNIVTLPEDVLVQKFISTPLHLQLSFVQSFQRVEYITAELEFPIRADTCHTTIQQILSMYAQIFGLYHDETISEAFLGFLMYLPEGVRFDFPKLIVESICYQLSNFNTLPFFKYQSFLMYLIVDKFSDLFQQFLELEQLTPYEVVSIVHIASFLRDPSKGFFYFVNEFASRVYFFIFDVNYPRGSSTFSSISSSLGRESNWRLVFVS